MAKTNFRGLADAFHAADAAMTLTPAGNGGFGLDHGSMMPKKPQSPAQKSAVVKAAGASVAKRKIAAGLPAFGMPKKL